MTDTVLDIQNLKVHFKRPRKNLLAPQEVVHAVDGVSFSVKRGTTFGIVGESGSGKSTTALALSRLAHITDGSVTLDGTDITNLEGAELRKMRQRIQMIFQDPYSSLNPRMRAGAIVREPMDLLDVWDPEEREGRVEELFRRVGLRPEQKLLFPHQFSGGQRQRIGIARALASQPDVIVCDEPVSALDVAIQAQILNLLRQLQQEFGLSYLFISHDLGVVQYLCDELVVMYLGQVVEQGDRVSLFSNPKHPYTWALLSAVPSADLERTKGKKRVHLTGDPPSPINLPKGCRFADRCPFAEDQCHATPPELKALPDGHKVACHLVGADGAAPHMSM